MITLYDDALARTFEPFATSRPLGEMRAGAVLGRERWASVLHAPVTAFASSPHLSNFTEFAAPASARGVVDAGTWIVNTRALPIMPVMPVDSRQFGDVLSIQGRVAAVRIKSALDATRLRDGTLSLESLVTEDAHCSEVDGVWIDALWDIIGHLSQQLTQDIPAYAIQLGIGRREQAVAHDTTALAGPLTLGECDVFIEPGAHVEPFTVLDATNGPILIRHDAKVLAFTRVVGPCYIGPHSIVTTDRVAASSIGDHCRVHGELSMTVLVGHANKGHDGFVGHSLLGRWVNLGAGTITSNLKNSYGTVAMWTPAGLQDTGLQFAGTFFGDHVKTGIGLRLTTGCIVGVGANIMDAMPPKVVAPFSWGTAAPYATFAPDKFLETAARVMARRQVVLDPLHRTYLHDVLTHAIANQRWPR